MTARGGENALLCFNRPIENRITHLPRQALDKKLQRINIQTEVFCLQARRDGPLASARTTAPRRRSWSGTSLTRQLMRTCPPHQRGVLGRQGLTQSGTAQAVDQSLVVGRRLLSAVPRLVGAQAMPRSTGSTRCCVKSTASPTACARPLRHSTDQSTDFLDLWLPLK